MILVFNKQYRQEEKLFRELKNKIKQSKSMVKDTDGKFGEFFSLDSIDIQFFYGTDKYLKVFDKSGNIIVNMDIHYFGNCVSDEQELANARWNMFNNLFTFARDTYTARIEKAKKLERATKEIQEKKTKLDKAARDKEAAEAAIVNATTRLKSL